MVGANAASNLAERDYILGFSDDQTKQKHSSSYGNHVKVETELKLGIGPVSVGSPVSSSSSVRVSNNSTDATVDKPLENSTEVSKEQNQVGAGSKFIATSAGACTASTGVFLSTPSVSKNRFWMFPGLAPGTYMIPVPKVLSNIVPAKRPYVDAIAESSNKIGTVPSSGGEKNTPSEGMKPNSAAMAAVNNSVNKAPGGAGNYLNYYLNSNNNQSTCNVPLWRTQHPSSASIPPKAGFSSGVAYPTTTARVFQPQQTSLPLTTNPPASSPSASFKIPPAPAAPASDSTSKPEATIRPHGSAINKAPVVGWPPLNTYRKHHHSTTSNGSKDEKEAQQQSTVEKNKDGHLHKAVVEAQIEPTGSSNLYVKVKLDGVRICRKVDLKAYDSYESLKSDLQEMFQAFCSDNGVKLDLLEGKNYVLTHEDKDGDWMLVGDVPWHMFVDSTVKSFRIMKAADAIGLGVRKADDTGNW